MITLISGLTGLLGSFLPSLLDILKFKIRNKSVTSEKDQAFELKKLELEIEKLKLVAAKDASFNERVSSTQAKGGVIDFIRGTVRPVITYAIFSLYAFVKCITLYKAYNLSVVLLNSEFDYSKIWSVEDQSLFALIIAFWFGQRTIAHITK